MLKFIAKYGYLFFLFVILSGCATFQHVPVPEKLNDPNSATIILKRLNSNFLPHNKPSVFDNGKPIGEIGSGGQLIWNRDEGKLELDIKHISIFGVEDLGPRRIHRVFDVKKNNVYTLNYVFGNPSSISLEGENAGEIKFTSSPPGAFVYAGKSKESLQRLNFRTPHTMSLPSGKSHWAAEYYKMTLAGYEDSAVVYKNDTYSDREVHFTLKPLSPEIATDQPISISITSPEIDRGLKIVLKSSTLTITGGAKGGSGIAEVLVNGQQAALDDQGQFSSEVLLRPGKNQITISATDTQRKSNTRTFSITREIVKVLQKPEIEIKEPVAAVTIKTGKYHALIIAVQDYSSKEINKLDQPIADAIAIKNILTERYTFDDKNIVFLKNPDRKTIGTAFNNLRKKLSENDNLLIFYAGHGVWMDDMKEGYWLPRDASGINNPTDWIPNSTIRNYIRALKAKHVLLVADACFSGGIFKVREAFTSPNASIEKIYEMQSRKAITSGSLKTVPDRSVFVEYLAKRLRENKENYLDAQKLFVSFKEAVINNSPNNQTPLYGAISEAGDEGGDFVFVRRQQ